MEKQNTVYCRIVLQFTREEAKKERVRVPKLQVYRSDRTADAWYEVFVDSQGKWDESKEAGTIWTGYADNKYDAKARAIRFIIDSVHYVRGGACGKTKKSG